MNPYKILAILILLLIIIDAYSMLHINKQQPSITSRPIDDNIKTLESMTLISDNEQTDVKSVYFIVDIYGYR